MSMRKRIVSLILVISLVGALCVPAFAASAVSGIGFDTNLDASSALYWRDRMDGSVFLTALEYLGAYIIGGVSDNSGELHFDKYALHNWVVQTVGYGEVSISQLRQCRNTVANRFGNGLYVSLTKSMTSSEGWKQFVGQFLNTTNDPLCRFQLLRILLASVGSRSTTSSKLALICILTIFMIERSILLRKLSKYMIGVSLPRAALRRSVVIVLMPISLKIRF